MLAKKWTLAFLALTLTHPAWARLETGSINNGPMAKEEQARRDRLAKAYAEGNEMAILDNADSDDVTDFLAGQAPNGTAERITSDQIGPQFTERFLINLNNNKGHQRMYWFHNGQLQKSFVVSGAVHEQICKDGGYCNTPRGLFAVHKIDVLAHSRAYENSPMPCALFFNAGGNYAIHGTEAVSHLGRPASHGCVRTNPAVWCPVFNQLTDNGTNFQHNILVQIVDQIPKEDLTEIRQQALASK